MKVFELLNSEDKWTTRFFALDKDNYSINWRDSSAVKYDFMGAIFKCYSKDELHTIFKRIYKTPEMEDQKSLPFYNQQWGYRGIMEFCKKYDI